MTHPDDCPCTVCESSRLLNAFVAIGETLQEGGLPWEVFGGGEPLPKRRPVIQRTEKEQADHEATIKKEAHLLGMAARVLPKKRGRKKKHTPKELIELLRGFEAIQVSTPGKSEKEVLELYLQKVYQKQGKRTSRVFDVETQAEIKTVQNLLAEARKLVRKYRT